jgi:hypothetical protein
LQKETKQPIQIEDKKIKWENYIVNTQRSKRQFKSEVAPEKEHNGLASYLGKVKHKHGHLDYKAPNASRTDNQADKNKKINDKLDVPELQNITKELSAA